MRKASGLPLRVENGFLPIRYGQSGHRTAVHLATSWTCPHEQSRHFARITFDSGIGGWISASRDTDRGSSPWPDLHSMVSRREQGPRAALVQPAVCGNRAKAAAHRARSRQRLLSA